MVGFSLVAPQPDLLDTSLVQPGWSGGVTDLTDPSAFSWSEVVASTPEDWAGFHVASGGTDSHAMLLMIASGPSGSEEIMAMIPADYLQNAAEGVNFSTYLPLPVPAGTRLSWQWLGATTVTKPAQIFGVRASDFPVSTGLTKLDSGPFNIDAAFPEKYHGVILAHPAANNTKSAWTELSFLSGNAATSNAIQGSALPHHYKYIGFALRILRVGTSVNLNFSYDIGYGPAGSETILIEGIHSLQNIAAPRQNPFASPLWLPWDRPAGDRIAIRLQTDNIALLPSGVGVTAVLLGLR